MYDFQLNSDDDNDDDDLIALEDRESLMDGIAPKVTKDQFLNTKWKDLQCLICLNQHFQEDYLSSQHFQKLKRDIENFKVNLSINFASVSELEEMISLIGKDFNLYLLSRKILIIADHPQSRRVKYHI